jgi:hypothetical protein
MPMLRFWTLDGKFLREQYFNGRFAGYEDIQSYECHPALTGIAVEPNTCGLWATDGSQLYYVDRREPMPDRLDRTFMAEEPFYNLLASYDRTEDGVRYLTLTPLATPAAKLCHKWRLVLETPESETGKMYVGAPDGSLLNFSPYAGWQNSTPEPISFPVTEDGTYVFTLETADASGTITRDTAVYANLFFRPLASFDLTRLVPSIQGIAFDSRQRLWVWDGMQLTPLRIHYDAYTLDADSNQQFVYLTDDYDRVEIS